MFWNYFLKNAVKQNFTSKRQYHNIEVVGQVMLQVKKMFRDLKAEMCFAKCLARSK